MVVVITIVGILAAISTPAVKGLYNSMITEGSAEAMVQAAFSNARSIAISRQKYAGVRFQLKFDKDDINNNRIVDVSQYMIFVIHDPQAIGYTNGFRAIEGKQPIELPGNFGVMDLKLGQNDPFINIVTNGDINKQKEFIDTTAFSIVFSPQGKVIVHQIRVFNRNGKTNDSSYDHIFNIADIVEGNVIDKEAMFYQDDSSVDGLQQEKSRRSFVIYNKNEFKQIDDGNRWDGYLKDLDLIYINPYSGELIKRD